MKIWFTLFEKWKVKWKSDSLFSRNEKWNKNLIHSFREVKSEMKMPRDRDREVKFLENSREFTISWKFSRNCRKPKKKKVFTSRPSFFPPLAFECIVVLPTSLMEFFSSFNFCMQSVGFKTKVWIRESESLTLEAFYICCIL